MEVLNETPLGRRDRSPGYLTGRLSDCGSGVGGGVVTLRGRRRRRELVTRETEPKFLSYKHLLLKPPTFWQLVCKMLTTGLPPTCAPRRQTVRPWMTSWPFRNASLVTRSSYRPCDETVRYTWPSPSLLLLSHFLNVCISFGGDWLPN